MNKFLKFGLATAAVAFSIGQAAAEPLFGLTEGGQIVTFDSTNPSATTSTRSVTGLLEDDILLGIDLRPSNRTLYSIGRSGTVYQLTRTGTTYTATALGDVNGAGDLGGTRFGIDFNPVPDRLRFITDGDLNYRINVDTFGVTVDGTISAPGAEAVVGVAYTNNDNDPATGTTIYALDASGNQLLTSTAPNSGVYTNVATITTPGGIDLGGLNNVGFDISGRSGIAYFVDPTTGTSTVPSVNRLYTLNLTTGVATSLGEIGAGQLIGLTAFAGVPEPATWALMIGGFGMVGGAMRVRSRKARFAAA